MKGIGVRTTSSRDPSTSTHLTLDHRFHLLSTNIQIDAFSMEVAVCSRRAYHGNNFSRLWTSASTLPLHSSLRVGHTVNSIWSLRLFSTCHVKSDASKHLQATQEDEAVQCPSQAVYLRQWRERRRLDPDFLTKSRERDRFRDAKRKPNLDMDRQRQLQREAMSRLMQTNPAYKLRATMQNLVLRNPWVREELPWKTHTPILYPAKIEHKCAKCVVTRHGGNKMWWKRKLDLDPDDNELYECHKCYFTGSEAMPEGYEDIKEVTLTALKKRKIELDGPHSIPQQKKKNTKTTTTDVS